MSTDTITWCDQAVEHVNYLGQVEYDPLPTEQRETIKAVGE